MIYDANNGTRAARQRLAEKFDKAGIHVVILGSNPPSSGAHVAQLFAETLCDNKEIIETNIRNVKISSPDVCMRRSDSWEVIRTCSSVSWLGSRQGR